ncbi:glycosyltransferase family 2 protein [Glaciimonas sp. CA11.2]|uniref:glycosyltransferase family 2 protein n=1 Tax=Glaciimonas sp. CA11.2 TaxID=3048601 RepID=UPI002AB4CD80|nr:glycosyltransferase family 2 protein [Glaciimonas sp. CA11.2]MDY7545039.1 glycosyltransferase family 2 protein [Glaciimonas sp. CA11.2]MEB0163701.1 glycosyltransferase family 2 protein [Glaciimonas sp. CA11.2]
MNSVISQPNRTEVERILVFIPAYNCNKQITRVLDQFKGVESYFTEILVVDNQSPDNTLEAVCQSAKLSKLPMTIIRNDGNYGLGGSHKVAFGYATENNFDYCIVLHGDDQGNIHDLIPQLEAGAHRSVDCLLGARFAPNAKLEGYSLFRRFGNQVFNVLFSIVAGKRLYDLGSGLNLYRVSSIAREQYNGFANNLTFNYFMILASVHWGWNICFFPITWREDDQISNVKLARQSMQVLSILARYIFQRSTLLSQNFSGRNSDDYKYTVIARHNPCSSLQD